MSLPPPRPDRPRYARWPLVPTHLKSKTALKRAGLRPTTDPVAEVHQRQDHQIIELYDERHAQPRPPATPAQLAALERANAARRRNLTCAGCGRITLSYKEAWRTCEEPDLCRDCGGVPEFTARAHAGRALREQNLMILEAATTAGTLSGIALLASSGEVLLDASFQPEGTRHATGSPNPHFPGGTAVPRYVQTLPQLVKAASHASRILTWDGERVRHLVDQALRHELPSQAPDDEAMDELSPLHDLQRWWGAGEGPSDLHVACRQAGIAQPSENSARARARALLDLVRATAPKPEEPIAR